jgi:hypothetical protein
MSEQTQKIKGWKNIMKVTKIVREHIEDKIEKLYQPAVDKIDDELKSLDRQIDEAKTKIKDKVNKVVVDFIKKEGFIPYNDELGFSLYLYSAPKEVIEKRNELKLKKQELKAKRDNTIMDILVELELGGTKETLDKLLEKAIKEFNN